MAPILTAGGKSAVPPPMTSRAADTADRAEAPPAIAYILTDYPRLAMTFISGEIDAIERGGCPVFPVAMNAPSAGELVTAEARARRDRTLYLKAAPARIVAAVAAAFLRHPLAMTRLAAMALRSAGSDIGQGARRLVHLAYAAHVARYCRRHGIRHLHAHFVAPATIAWFASDILRIQGVRDAGWSFTLHGPHDLFNTRIARMDLKAASARFVACISHFARSQLYWMTDRQDWHKLHVVRCGIDLAAFSPRQPRRFGTRARIVTVGRIAPEKGHPILIQALRMLVDSGVDAEVEIIGAGPFEAAVRHEAQRLDVADRVIFAGEVPPDQLSARLAAADIFCMPSFAEGLPISIMEAMATGIPVVCTWISGIPELAINEVTAMTVPPGDAAALAAALTRTIEDEPLRERLVAAARDEVSRLHSRDRTIAALDALFRGQSPPDAT